MLFKPCNKFLCIASTLLGLILIGLGVFLLATGFGLAFITIGTIIAGILLLVLGCFIKKPVALCFLLALVTLFLIIVGILAILFAGALIIGLILIGLGIIALLLAVVCICNNCGRDCDKKHDKITFPPGLD